MTARVGVITFPGSLDDRDAVRAVARAGATPVRLWLWTSAENAARSYQCGDDGCDGVHLDHA